MSSQSLPQLPRSNSVQSDCLHTWDSSVNDVIFHTIIVLYYLIFLHRFQTIPQSTEELYHIPANEQIKKHEDQHQRYN